MRSFLLIALSFFAGAINAQTSSTYKNIQVKLDSGLNQIMTGTYFSSFKLSSSSQNSVLVKWNDKEMSVPTYAPEHEEFPANFVILDTPAQQLIINAPSELDLNIELFYASPITISEPKAYRFKTDSCNKPLSIDQSAWREGLAEPVIGRTATVVNHCVIHHAASSNANTDYTAVVRNIYLLHTQSNGWDDIGYNYLIAPNGDVYDGRESQGVADEDNIQGAHFCGKNGGTMGICLIGDYTEIAPADTMIGSLVNLLTWKLNKEKIQAFDSFKHPDNASDYLPAIAMHRLGCSTLCPGDSVAFRMESIRSSVDLQLQNCSPSASLSDKEWKALSIYPNPSTGMIHLANIPDLMRYEIKDITMRTVDFGFLEMENQSLKIEGSGVYYLFLYDASDTLFIEKILIH